MSRGKSIVSGFALLVALVSLCAPALADPPDSLVNPASGQIEIADVAPAGAYSHVRHTINPGQQKTLTVVELTAGPVSDMSPRIAISSGGDTWITWWRDGSTRQVLVRKRTFSTGTWTPERLVNIPTQSSKKPQILHDGKNAWIAYEYAYGGTTSIAAAGVIDYPDPIEPITLANTSFSGDVNVLAHSVSGHLWVSWVDSANLVGWCEYSYSSKTWGPEQTEPYGSDGVAAARSRVQAKVLGN